MNTKHYNRILILLSILESWKEERILKDLLIELEQTDLLVELDEKELLIEIEQKDLLIELEQRRKRKITLFR